MKRIIVAVMLSLAVPGVQAQSISGSPFIAVHGKAKTEVVPDIFPLEIALEETSKETAKTQALIEGYAQKIIELTQFMKMADRDVDISNLSVSPEYEYDDKSDRQVFLGNTYHREIKLRFHTLEELKKAIESLPQAKQVRLDTGSFQSSKSEELRRELLTQAVEDARTTAEVMAKAVGKRVGTVHNISNQGFNVRYVESGGDGYSRNATTLDSVTVTGAAVASPPLQLKEGHISLDQNVYIIYTLVD